MTKFVNTLIVLATLALVSLPVIYDQLPTEIARWYLASAANRVSRGEPVDAQLAQARAWGGELSELRDYWLLRCEQALATSPASVASVVSEAVARDPAYFDIGYHMAQRLAEHAEFAEAVAVLEAALVGELRQVPRILNELAYFRALAGIELDRALQDIERALEANPDAPEQRDTRAWVLFQMGRPQEALADADFAVQAFDRLGPRTTLEKGLAWLEQRIAPPPEPRSAEQTLTRREAGELLWDRGAVHYHRAKILEALGRSEEAQEEFDWLHKHRLPADERIY